MKVLAAMSGGVYSAVAAARAVAAGHDVIGVHLALSTNPATLRTGSRGCCSREDAGDAIHPTRHLMLKDEEAAQAGAGGGDNDGQRRRTRRPGYYDKQLERAEQRRTEAEERAKEAQRRREEREKRLAERDRYKRAMAKTRGKDGKKKLGRESTLLLDKVKKMVAEK